MDKKGKQRTFVGSLFDLLVVGSFPHEFVDSDGKVGVGQGECFGVHSRRHGAAEEETMKSREKRGKGQRDEKGTESTVKES